MSEARKHLDGIVAKIELKHEDYDPVSGVRISVHPPGTYEQWRAGIAGYVIRLSAER